MKTKKNIYIFIIAIFAVSALSYGFIYKNIFKSHTSSPPPPLTPQEQIVGTWLRENHPTDKLVFLANGEMKRYFDNVLQYTDTYSISNTCDGQTRSNGDLFLNEYDGEDGSESCMFFNGITADGQTLSLTPAESMKVYLYIRQ